MIELLSRGELGYYLLLRWNDNVDDIREQFPLDLKETNVIAKQLGFRAMHNGRKRMTTDMLVTMTDGTEIAISIKVDRASFSKTPRKVELQMIEYYYWKRKGIPWIVLYREDLNPIEVENIMDVVSYYNMTMMPDEIGLAKYLIAHKYIEVNLTEQIDFVKLVEDLKGDEIWTKYSYMLA